MLTYCLKFEVSRLTVNLNWSFYRVTGKSPLFEVRQMEVDPRNSLKSSEIHIEKTDITDGERISGDLDSDEEDLGHPPGQPHRWSTSRFVKKRSSPLCVYTYKVPSSIHFYLFFSTILFL